MYTRRRLLVFVFDLLVDVVEANTSAPLPTSFSPRLGAKLTSGKGLSTKLDTWPPARLASRHKTRLRFCPGIGSEFDARSETRLTHTRHFVSSASSAATARSGEAEKYYNVCIFFRWPQWTFRKLPTFQWSWVVD